MKPLKLTERDKRALILGGILVTAMLGYGLLLEPWWRQWSRLRTDAAVLQKHLEKIVGHNAADIARRRVLAEKTPLMAFPNTGEEQRLIFKKAMIQQARKSGLALTNIRYTAEKKARNFDGHALLFLEGRAAGPTDAVLKYLADLYRNEHICAIETLELVVEEKDRNKMQLQLTVSTLVKQAKT